LVKKIRIDTLTEIIIKIESSIKPMYAKYFFLNNSLGIRK